MRNPGGYALWADPDRPSIERDTFTCCHCNTVAFVTPGADPSTEHGFCIRCMKHTCRSCTDKGSCTPYEKAMEAQEKKITDRILRDSAVSKILGR